MYFMPHAMFMKYLKWFNVPNYIDIPIDKPFQDVLVESNLIITDFSSNSLEMAYMDKPSVIYVPGVGDVKQNMPHYHMENFHKYKNMTYCSSMSSALETAKTFLG